jgi:uncharacterized protein YidB (DUF937 family)
MSIFGSLGSLISGLVEQYGGPEAIASEVFQQMGGVQGVLNQLQQAGLGGQVQSWLGDGQNQQVSPEQIGQALGHGPIADIAAKFGIDPSQMTEMIAHALPGMIDKMSANGSLQTPNATTP